MHSHMLTVSCMICKHSASGALCKIIPVSDITSGVCPLATHIWPCTQGLLCLVSQLWRKLGRWS